MYRYTRTPPQGLIPTKTHISRHQKYQILCYHWLSMQQHDFKASCNQLFTALQPHGYTKVFLNKIKKQILEDIKSPIPKEIKGSKFKCYLNKPNSNYSSSKCNRKYCQTCPTIVKASTFKNLSNSRVPPSPQPQLQIQRSHLPHHLPPLQPPICWGNLNISSKEALEIPLLH